MTDRELMAEALEIMLSAINSSDWKVDGACDPHATLVRLTNQLSKPVQEPVAWLGDADGFPVYPAPPQREWVGLTDKEIEDLWNQHESRFDYYSFSCDIEAKLKEKNA